MATRIKAITIMDKASGSLLRLMTWLSPSFPVGGFAYSQGLEAACKKGLVGNAESLSQWLETSLASGPLRSDAILLAAAHGGKAEAANQLALALAGSAERHAETMGLGSAFVEAAGPWVEGVYFPDPVAYPVAIGITAGSQGIALQDTLAAFLHASLSSTIQAALRLMPLGQTKGVKLLAGLENQVQEQAGALSQLGLDDLGSSAFLMDIVTMQHQFLPGRMFRS